MIVGSLRRITSERSASILVRSSWKYLLTPLKMSRSYRAAVCKELGKPLELDNITNNEPLQSGEVRLAVHDAAIAFATVLTVAGKYQEKPPVPFVPGNEVAGKVIEVGPDVSTFKPGDRVVSLLPTGGFAEECVAYEGSLWKIPDAVTFKNAAAALVNYGTAYTALKRRADIKPGDYVLVTAAAGGVGLAAVDLASRVFGAKVIAACGGPEKCEVTRQGGAHYVIDYKQDNIKQKVMEFTNDHGADVIFENVGGNIFKECLRSIALEGRLLVIGFASGDIPKIPANQLLLKSCSAVGLYWGNYANRLPAVFHDSVHQVLSLCNDGKAIPRIGATFSLEKVNEALNFVESRKSTGKVIIQVRQTSHL